MSYAGDVNCKEVFETLSSNPSTAMVDVRTTHEWSTIGVPDLSSISKEVVFAEWQMFPTMQVNPDFAKQVDEELQSRGVSKEDAVFFLCRSGVRSQGAASAMTALGYTKTYNILSGFEGTPDASGERAKIDGWKHDDLPWKHE